MITPYSNIISVTTLSGSLLDLYSGAAAAYSLRLLRTAYTGDAIEVRRASDNTTQDIGFVNNELDTISLESFCSGTDGFVTTWYDQSGNANDATQTTAANQPQIVSSGSVITENGKPALQFDGSNDNLGSNTFTSISQPITHFGVYKSSANAFVTSSNNSVDSRHILWSGNPTGGFRFFAGTAIVTSSTLTDNPNQILHYAFANGTSSETAIQGYVLTVGNAGTNPLTSIKIGSDHDSSNAVNGTVSEYIAFAYDQSSNRSGIETNINAQYNIYWDGSQTSLLDSYSGSAAAYSLRALSSAYTGPLVEVRRASDNATIDVYAKYDGTLNVDALESFCSGTNGFVTTWYDQSGNGYDATQTTASDQPQIVSSGSVIEENGKPAVQFDGSDDNFIQSDINILNDKPGGSMFVINKCDTTIVGGESVVDVSFTGGSSTRIWIAQGRTTALRYETGGRRLSGDAFSAITSNTNISTQCLISSICNYQNQDLILYQNATKVAENLNFQSSGNSESVNSNLAIGSTTGNSRYWDGNIQEIVIYDTDQSSNRSGIETNINDFYSIY